MELVFWSYDGCCCEKGLRFGDQRNAGVGLRSSDAIVDKGEPPSEGGMAAASRTAKR